MEAQAVVVYVWPRSKLIELLVGLGGLCSKFALLCYAAIPKGCSIMLKSSSIMLKSSSIMFKSSSIMLKSSSIMLKFSSIMLKSSSIMLKSSSIMLKSSSIMLKSSSVMLKSSSIMPNLSSIILIVSLVNYHKNVLIQHIKPCVEFSHPQPLLSGVFSLLKEFTEQQQTSLEDYIETALMIHYNSK